MDKEKEDGFLGTITDAAKTGMDAAVEGVSSDSECCRWRRHWHNEEARRRRRSTTKKTANSRGRTTT